MKCHDDIKSSNEHRPCDAIFPLILSIVSTVSKTHCLCCFICLEEEDDKKKSCTFYRHEWWLNEEMNKKKCLLSFVTKTKIMIKIYYYSFFIEMILVVFCRALCD
ncbi:hypothetical protein ACKWTF_013222 [Chironomus riparius]